MRKTLFDPDLQLIRKLYYCWCTPTEMVAYFAAIGKPRKINEVADVVYTLRTSRLNLRADKLMLLPQAERALAQFDTGYLQLARGEVTE